MAKLEEVEFNKTQQPLDKPIFINAQGTECPGPIMSLSDGMKKAQMGQHVVIEVTDKGFNTDVVSWCHVTGNELVSLTEDNGVIRAELIKHYEMGSAPGVEKEDSITLIVFSEELDKGLAAFNIALGALAMGMKVQVFFTFWGLSLLRKEKDRQLHKDDTFEDKMLDKILPKDDWHLPLSHANLMGMGREMMEGVMKKKNVPSLDFMLHLAKFDGVTFIACQMSMDIMNIKKEDLMEGVEVAGVATMLEYARKSSMQYFI